MPEKLVEVARSFAYKMNVGNYETRDFFCSQKAEVPEDEAEKKSEELYNFCREEVLKSVELYKAERIVNQDKAVKQGKEWQKKNKRAFSDVKAPPWSDDTTTANREVSQKEQLEIQEEMNDVKPEIREERLFEHKQRSQTESKAF